MLLLQERVCTRPVFSLDKGVSILEQVVAYFLRKTVLNAFTYKFRALENVLLFLLLK